MKQVPTAVVTPFSCSFLGCENVPADVDKRDGFIASLAGQEAQKKLYDKTDGRDGQLRCCAVVPRCQGTECLIALLLGLSNVEGFDRLFDSSQTFSYCFSFTLAED